jgi:hypothetical protein
MAMCFYAASFAYSMSPLTPTLTEETYKELVVKLKAISYPQYGEYSVHTAITAVLGFKPKLDRYESNTMRPNGLIIEAEAIPFDNDCATVFVRARHVQPSKHHISLEGLYCKQGLDRWQAKYQKVEHLPESGRNE